MVPSPLTYAYKFRIVCIMMYRNTITNFFRVMKLLSKIFRVKVMLQFGLCIQYIVIHVICNLYVGNEAWGFRFSWGSQTFMTPVALFE